MNSNIDPVDFAVHQCNVGYFTEHNYKRWKIDICKSAIPNKIMRRTIFDIFDSRIYSSIFKH